jgi:hypothetical protein
MLMKLGIVRGFCIALLAATSSAASAREVRTTLCELVSHGQPLSGQRVRFTAIYLTDLLERTVLLDKHCPKVHLTPYDSIEPPDPSVKKFDDAVRGRIGDLELRQFVVDVSGRFTWHGHDESTGSLEIQKVWRFKRIHGGSRASRALEIIDSLSGSKARIAR